MDPIMVSQRGHGYYCSATIDNMMPQCSKSTPVGAYVIYEDIGHITTHRALKGSLPEKPLH